MTLALVFPGQGSQHVGMGMPLAEAFPEARQVFEEVDDALGRALSRIVFEGPGDDLTATENAQPALLAVSMAVLRVLTNQGGLDVGGRAAFVAGHSLGEYAALAAAGALTLADAARLLDARGAAMKRAGAQAKQDTGADGSMSALLGADIKMAEEVVDFAAKKTGQICVVANDNGPGQVVISGHEPALDVAEELAKEAGAKRAVRLGVSAAFHSPLMAPAAEVMHDVLGSADLRSPLTPVVANVTAAPVSDAEEIRELLEQQITSRVRWRETVDAMGAAGVDTLVEVGAGKVLTGINRRINRDLVTVSVETPEDVEAFLKSL
ncbi:MAG: ACP S-malonyltransferase [Alphaproteobacteria bacterium]|jgi:[acyl-carrier-protein] S-malonyltransferase|nr:ACP S-malonyltransferase [Alphaproteobacteria bacterium]MBT5860862.1 ACP S-malonyltransferase [Alphaproteobacteria bacterium]